MIEEVVFGRSLSPVVWVFVYISDEELTIFPKGIFNGSQTLNLLVTKQLTCAHDEYDKISKSRLDYQDFNAFSSVRPALNIRPLR